jgi:glycosyltransferase involved in cell wall biosynthesis
MATIVSVIIPTHNRREFLPSAIASVLGQSFMDWELLVVDDGSQDDTADVVEPFLLDPRVRYVSQTQQGRSVARNRGIQMAQGKWVAFLDSDDRYLPNCLQDHLNTTAEQPNLAMTIGGYEYIDEFDQRLGERRPWDESKLSPSAWLFNCLAMPGSVLVARPWLEHIGGFDPGCEIAEDWDLFLRLAHAGGIMAWAKAMVCQYRQHRASSIHDTARHRDGSLRALDKFFRRPDLPGEIAGLASQAKAWVYVVFARRAFAAGLAESALQDLQHALDLDPALAGDGRPQLLETLFSPEMIGQQAEADMVTAVMPHLPAALKRHPDDIRRAQARVHIARFFRADSDGTQERAAAHLRAGVRLDPRWLLNRGVLAYCVRQAFGRTRPTVAKAHDQPTAIG